MNVYYFHHQADELLGTASEQFLGKSVKEIKQTILQTLEGHLRAILGKVWARNDFRFDWLVWNTDAQPHDTHWLPAGPPLLMMPPE